MSGKLERLKWEMYGFIESDDLKKEFNEVYNKIVEANKDNLEAVTPIGNFTMEKANVGYLEYGIDYVVNTGSYIDSEGNYWNSEEEYNQHMEDLAEKKFEQYTFEEDEDGDWEIKDEQGNFVEYVLSEDEALDRIEELKNEWLDDNCEELEYEDDEVVWNVAIRFNDHVDVGVAKRVGLGVLEIVNPNREDFEEEYMFLQTAGMDMTPKYIAYQALTYGCIGEEYLHYFRPMQLSYTKYVMGSCFEEVIETLGIKEIVEKYNNK